MNSRLIRTGSAASAGAFVLIACHAFAGPKATPSAPSKTPITTAKVIGPAGATTSISSLRGDAVAKPAPLPILPAIAPSKFCVTEGAAPIAGPWMHVDTGAMRGFVSTDRSTTVELDFNYRGPSKDTQTLLDGEVRRQIGIKLKAQDTCNVAYVMWYAEGDVIHVLLKRNAGKSTYTACKDGGYVAAIPSLVKPVPALVPGVAHVLRAELSGRALRVIVDHALVWEGFYPAAVEEINGPPGVRSDNIAADFQVHVPGGAATARACR